MLLCLGVGLPLTSLLPAAANTTTDLLISFLVAGAVHIVFDAVLVTLFGKTIGKALLGLTVTNAHGPVRFQVALRRALRVWARGNGCYMFFPLVPLLAWRAAYKAALASGETDWDRLCQTTVKQGQVGLLRFVGGGLLGLVSVLTAAGVAFVLREVGRPSIADTTVNAIAPSRLLDLDAEKLPRLKDYEVQPWSGNVSDQWKSVGQIEALAGERDPRLRAHRAWSAVLQWQRWHTRHNGMDRSPALYRAVDNVLTGLQDGDGICFPTEEQLLRFELPAGEKIAVEQCDGIERGMGR